MTSIPGEDAYPRGRLGFICVANAGLTEGDMFAMRPAGVGLSFTRVRMRTECTLANLAEMKNDLEDAVGTLFPGRDDLDVTCYNCTAGSFVIGEARVKAIISGARPNTRATTLLSGVIAAFETLGVRRIALATAYTDDINTLEAEYFSGNGYEIVNMEGLGLLTDVEMNRVAPDTLLAFAESVDRPDADALFLSCGALRSTEIIERLEHRIGKPVIGSNQASFWNCMRLAGIDDRVDGFGRLLREH